MVLIGWKWIVFVLLFPCPLVYLNGFYGFKNPLKNRVKMSEIDGKIGQNNSILVIILVNFSGFRGCILNIEVSVFGLLGHKTGIPVKTVRISTFLRKVLKSANFTTFLRNDPLGTGV